MAGRDVSNAIVNHYSFIHLPEGTNVYIFSFFVDAGHRSLMLLAVTGPRGTFHSWSPESEEQVASNKCVALAGIKKSVWKIAPNLTV